MTDFGAIKKIHNILAKLTPEAQQRVLDFVNSQRFEAARKELVTGFAQPQPTAEPS